MGYPKTWDDIEAKLKVLYPKDDERGTLRKKLLDMDDDKKALRHFQDSDASVKATLDGYLTEGMQTVQVVRSLLEWFNFSGSN